MIRYDRFLEKNEFLNKIHSLINIIFITFNFNFFLQFSMNFVKKLNDRLSKKGKVSIPRHAERMITSV